MRLEWCNSKEQSRTIHGLFLGHQNWFKKMSKPTMTPCFGIRWTTNERCHPMHELSPVVNQFLMFSLHLGQVRPLTPLHGGLALASSAQLGAFAPMWAIAPSRPNFGDPSDNGKNKGQNKVLKQDRNRRKPSISRNSKMQSNYDS